MRQVFGSLLLVTGCAAPVAAPLPERVTPRPTEKVIQNVAADDSALRRAVQRYLSGRPGRASVMVTELRSGSSFGFHEDGGFVGASITKVDILIARLLTGERLSDRERRLSRRMIRFSDNLAADALYRVIGDSQGLVEANTKFDLTCTFPYPVRWGATRTCPADQIKLLRLLVDRESPVPDLSRAYALNLMTKVTPSQRWGVTAAALPGDRVALKNGWTPLRFQGSGWAVNSIGRVTGHGRDFLIAVFTSEQPSMLEGVQTVEQLAKMTTDALRD